MTFGSVKWEAAPGALLVLLIVMAEASASTLIPPQSAQRMQVVAAARDSVPIRQQRRFEHRRHERLTCTSCHGTGENHRTILVRTPADCASCHHDAARAQACSDCHREGPPAARPVAVSMSLTVWDSTRTRVLPFSHDIHAALVCRECHNTPVTLAPKRECASCHTQHHRPEATCTTCHVPARAGVHGLSVHLSCAGSGCHASEVAPAPPLSRALCLTCHTQQRGHEPGRTCTDCHWISPSTGHPANGLLAARREPVKR